MSGQKTPRTYAQMKSQCNHVGRLAIPCRALFWFAGRPFRRFALLFPTAPSGPSEAACFVLRRAFAPVLPPSLSLMSWLWLLVARVVRFCGLWDAATRAVPGAGWGVVRRLAVRVEVRSAIAVARWTQSVPVENSAVDTRAGYFIVLDSLCKMRKWFTAK